MKNLSNAMSFSMEGILGKSWSIFTRNFVNILCVLVVTYLPVSIISYLFGGHFSDFVDVKLSYYPV